MVRSYAQTLAEKSLILKLIVMGIDQKLKRAIADGDPTGHAKESHSITCMLLSINYLISRSMCVCSGGCRCRMGGAVAPLNFSKLV